MNDDNEWPCARSVDGAAMRIIKQKEKQKTDDELRAELMLLAMKLGVEGMLRTNRGVALFGTAAKVQFSKHKSHIEIVTKDSIYRIGFA